MSLEACDSERGASTFAASQPYTPLPPPPSTPEAASSPWNISSRAALHRLGVGSNNRSSNSSGEGARPTSQFCRQDGALKRQRIVAGPSSELLASSRRLIHATSPSPSPSSGCIANRERRNASPPLVPGDLRVYRCKSTHSRCCRPPSPSLEALHHGSSGIQSRRRSEAGRTSSQHSEALRSSSGSDCTGSFRWVRKSSQDVSLRIDASRRGSGARQGAYPLQQQLLLLLLQQQVKPTPRRPSTSQPESLPSPQEMIKVDAASRMPSLAGPIDLES
ncbi:hypothetical protein K437DRAFT_267103 [Tilletiaria anomala UBC 951]|uniref:Uncharacterized protein n=1 Tax=Tilletiaria anomala (strain ATCC 24038 / CBS 436.72 / UBC 951) TaxID=1037660 RepID=A0A066WBX5_TILAU|nr:uncharacterized protein K437DRAFT_267103 [Tilletiaria anomala UBC 951]KDN51437.1 hypothetical protein K437DRAFT_267103 [Tilletiaria anomala UBC 951]